MNYRIVGKYIKNLKFEIPNPKIFFLLEKNISNYKINVDIKSQRYEDKIIEIVITLSLNPIVDLIDKINTKIAFATIVEIDGDFTKKSSLEEIILIKVPNEVYSEIRSLFIFLFEKSGFKKIKIDEKVDFKKLYEQRSIQ